MTDRHEPASEPEVEVERSTRASTILGRLVRAAKEQNWFAVVLELVIVIAGVVIGFQVTAWGQQRDLNRRAALQQEALREDFLANRRQLTNVLVELELAASQQREMLRVLHGASRRPGPDTLAALVFSTITFARFEPVLGAYHAMLSAGDLRLIRDPELRSNLARFAEMAESGFEDEEQMTALRVRLIGYLGEHGDVLSIMYPSWRQSLDLPSSSMTMDFDALLTSPEFSTLATNMAFGEAAMVNFYHSMGAYLDAVLVGLGVDLVGGTGDSVSPTELRPPGNERR